MNGSESRWRLLVHQAKRTRLGRTSNKLFQDEAPLIPANREHVGQRDLSGPCPLLCYWLHYCAWCSAVLACGVEQCAENHYS